MAAIPARRLYIVPVLFFFLAACLGLLLRYVHVAPWINFPYTYFLHAHSHVMFLGWITNVLVLAFQHTFRPIRYFLHYFFALQVCVTGMLIAFPLQGYGPITIVLSAVHTVILLVMMASFFRANSRDRTLSVQLARLAWIWGALSALGPMALGYFKTHGLEHAPVYHHALYFYLHFQYNGFFFFGVLSLWWRLAQLPDTGPAAKPFQRSIYILAVACLITFFLSTLWALPGFGWNVIGGVGALLQIVAAYRILPLLWKSVRQHTNQHIIQLLLVWCLVSWVIKLLLQLLSAWPPAAVLAYTYRGIVIAYLHLVLIGVISTFLLAWLFHHNKLRTSVRAVLLLLIGLLCTNVLLILQPWFSRAHIPVTVWLLAAAMVLVMSAAFLLRAALRTDH